MNKKIVSMLSLLVAVLSTAFTACSGSGKDVADKVISEERVYAIVDKFDEGKIEEKDYTEAIEIFRAYNDKMMAEAEKQLEACKTEREFDKKMQRFVDKYIFVRELSLVFDVPESKMGKENSAKLLKLNQEMQAKMQKLQGKIEAKFYKGSNPAAMPAEFGSEPVVETVAAEAPEIETAAVAPAPAPAAK